MKKPEKILVFIPIYNCEDQISRVLSQFKDKHLAIIDEILIIDNRSHDQSLIYAQKALESYIHNCKARIFKNHQNYSLGGSIKIAFNYACHNQFDYLITLHGDDQAYIEEALQQIETGVHRQHEMCIGARFHQKSTLEGYSYVRSFGNQALNFLCSLITRRKIIDLIAGLNIYDVNFIRKAYPDYLSFPDNLTFDVHWLLYLIKSQARFTYFPITWREKDQISNAKVFKQTAIILWLFLKFAINKKKLFCEPRIHQDFLIEYSYDILYEK